MMETTIDAAKVERKLSDARMLLVRLQPFYAHLALSVPYIAADWCPTMATDGKSIVYGPAFVAATPLDQLAGVIAHEAAHIGFGDHVRRGARDPDLFNIAADYRINPMIKDSGLALPDGCLFDPRFGPHMTVEAIYKILEQERARRNGGAGKPQNGAQPGASKPPAGAGDPGKGTAPAGASGAVRAPDGRQCPSAPGGVLDMPGDQPGTAPSPAEIGQELSRARAAMAQAKDAARRRGLLPANLAATVDSALAPVIDWREKLADWCNELAISDYSWRTPHRGYLVEAGIYAPAARDRTMGELVVATDISGSVGMDEFRQFAGELGAVHAALRPVKLHALQFTTRVVHHAEYAADDQLKLGTRHGSGGTIGQAVFDYVAEKGIEPVGIVVLTDLAIGSVADPGVPVLWVSTDPRGRSPEFGERVDLL